jgi:YVTN family beta-propeller protein
VGDAAVAFSPDGTTAYAGAGSVYVIDTSTLAVTTVIPTQFAGALGVTPDGTLLYVGGASLTEPGSIINTQSLQITATFPSGGGILIH